MRRSSPFATGRLFSPPPPSADDSLFGTCRALQSLLNGSPVSSPRHAKPKRLQSPLQVRTGPSARTSRKVAEQRQPTSQQTQTHKQQHNLSTATITTRNSPRRVNKRHRDVYEDSDSDSDLMNEDEDRHNIQTSTSTNKRHRFSTPTPKRRRRVPFDLPLGLSEDDFYSLRTPAPIAYGQQHDGDRYGSNSVVVRAQQSLSPLINPDSVLPSIEEEGQGEDNDNSTDDFSIPSPPSASNQDHLRPEWNSEDDETLVALELEKFQLSRQDWGDCARRTMGKDDLSVTRRRWEMLSGEGNGNVRLRRIMGFE